MSILALLHGFTGAPASWDDVLSRLPATMEVQRPALFGHGEQHTKGKDFIDEVDRLADLLAARKPIDVLCGYSLGGRLALSLSLRHPKSVRRLVLVGAHPGLEDEGARSERRHADAQWIALLSEKGIESFVAAWEALPLFADHGELSPTAQAKQRAIRLDHDPRQLAAALGILGLAEMPPTLSQLSKLDLPVHLVVGEYDAKFRAIAEEMAARLPRAHLSVVGGSGHNVALERPTALAAILQKEIAASAG